MSTDLKSKMKNLHWMSASFVILTGIFPSLKLKLWQWLYDKIAAFDISGNFLFMNYGYLNPQDAQLALEEVDEKFRYAIQLYDHVICGLEIKDKDVLEIGCGRGGGGSYIVRYKNPNFYIGIDLSEKAIKRCKHQHVFENAKWLHARADSIPLLNDSVDIIVNVESSHCYPSMEFFLQEVKRILRPNGHLAFCDLRPKKGIEKIEKIIHQFGFKIENKEIINQYVINSLDAFSDVRLKQIATTFNSFFHGTINDFAAIKNTSVYNKLLNGELIYFKFLLQKN